MTRSEGLKLKARIDQWMRDSDALIMALQRGDVRALNAAVAVANAASLVGGLRWTARSAGEAQRPEGLASGSERGLGRLND